MNRSDLIDRLAERAGDLTAGDCTQAVRVVIDAMREVLAKGGRVEIRGFGTFGLRQRPYRLSRNPRTGAAVEVPAKSAPYFRAGKELRNRVMSPTSEGGSL